MDHFDCDLHGVPKNANSGYQQGLLSHLKDIGYSFNILAKYYEFSASDD